MPSESTRVALLVTDMLERLSIVYAVEGSLANSEYGIARSTLEANIIADMRPEHVAPFVSALSRDFYADHHSIEDAINRQGTFTLVHYATKFNVDVIIPKLRPFDQMQLKRRMASVVSTDPPRQVSVTTAEDAILSKLDRLRTRAEGTQPAAVPPRGLADVIGMLKAKTGELDLTYLRRWAHELNVADLLEQALKET
jgi:hypothetical protein